MGGIIWGLRFGIPWALLFTCLGLFDDSGGVEDNEQFTEQKEILHQQCFSLMVGVSQTTNLPCLPPRRPTERQRLRWD